MNVLPIWCFNSEIFENSKHLARSKKQIRIGLYIQMVCYFTLLSFFASAWKEHGTNIGSRSLDNSLHLT